MTDKRTDDPVVIAATDVADAIHALGERVTTLRDLLRAAGRAAYQRGGEAAAADVSQFTSDVALDTQIAALLVGIGLASVKVHMNAVPQTPGGFVSHWRSRVAAGQLIGRDRPHQPAWGEPPRIPGMTFKRSLPQ